MQVSWGECGRKGEGGEEWVIMVGCESLDVSRMLLSLVGGKPRLGRINVVRLNYNLSDGLWSECLNYFLVEGSLYRQRDETDARGAEFGGDGGQFFLFKKYVCAETHKVIGKDRKTVAKNLESPVNKSQIVEEQVGSMSKMGVSLEIYSEDLDTFDRDYLYLYPRNLIWVKQIPDGNCWEYCFKRPLTKRRLLKIQQSSCTNNKFSTPRLPRDPTSTKKSETSPKPYPASHTKNQDDWQNDSEHAHNVNSLDFDDFRDFANNNSYDIPGLVDYSCNDIGLSSAAYNLLIIDSLWVIFRSLTNPRLLKIRSAKLKEQRFSILLPFDIESIRTGPLSKSITNERSKYKNFLTRAEPNKLLGTPIGAEGGDRGGETRVLVGGEGRVMV